MASGKVACAVLSYGGTLTLDDKLFAVRWSALKLDAMNKRFALNVPRDSLTDAPGFDKDHWPSMADQSSAAGVHNFYGTEYPRD